MNPTFNSPDPREVDPYVVEAMARATSLLENDIESHEDAFVFAHAIQSSDLEDIDIEDVEASIVHYGDPHKILMLLSAIINGISNSMDIDTHRILHIIADMIESGVISSEPTSIDDDIIT